MERGLEPRRVLFAISHTEPAGAQQLWADLAAGLLSRGHHVSMAAVYPHEKGVLQLPNGLAWQYSLDAPPATKLQGASAFWRTARLLRAAAPDVVFTALPAANVLFPLANALLGQPARIIPSHHSPVETHNPLLDTADSWSGRLASVHRIVCVSEAVRMSLVDKPASYYKKAVVIKNALSPRVEQRIEELNQLRASTRRHGKRIVACGRLSEQKNFPVLLRAMVELPDVTLQIVGGGPDEAALRELAARLGIVNRVAFLGPRSREDTLALMSEGHVFSQPSLYEGHSLALVEAAKLGLPLVVSEVPSQIEGVTLRNGTRCALTHASQDHMALAGVLARLFADEQTYTQHSNLAKSLGEESRFTAMLTEYEALMATAMVR